MPTKTKSRSWKYFPPVCGYNSIWLTARYPGRGFPTPRSAAGREREEVGIRSAVARLGLDTVSCTLYILHSLFWQYIENYSLLVMSVDKHATEGNVSLNISHLKKILKTKEK